MGMKRVWPAAVLALLLAAVPAAARADGNLLVNPGFETVGSGAPEGWKLKQYNYEEGYTLVSVGEGRAGNAAVIENTEDNDACFQQEVAVEPDTLYRLSGYILADGVAGGWGANLSYYDTYVYTDPLYDTGGQWRYVELYGRTGSDQDKAIVCVRLGGYSGEATGVAAFDDISLTRVDAVPEGYAEHSLASLSRDKDDGALSDYDYLGTVIWLSLLFLAAAVWALRRFVRPGGEPRNHGNAPYFFWGMMAAGFAVRVIVGAVITGYPNDIACWQGWANDTAANGLFGLYARGGFCDYPPGYMYVLWLIGKARMLLGVPSDSALFLVMVKMPSILADLATGYVLYRMTSRRWGNVAGAALAGLYLLNPATLVNTAAWGQIDSLLALFVLLFVWLLYERKIVYASVVFVLGVLLKPQMLLFGPALPVVFVHFIREEGGWKALKAFGISLAAGAAAAAAVALPFTQGQPLRWIIDIYTGTMSYYPYASLSACNVFGLMGALWEPNTGMWWGVTYKAWGNIGLALACLLFFIAALRDRRKERIFFYAAMLVTGIFGLGGMMHERYMYPALLLLAASAVLVPDRNHLRLFALFSLTQFANIALTLANRYMTGGDAVITLLSLLMIGGYAAMLAMAAGYAFPLRTKRIVDRIKRSADWIGLDRRALHGAEPAPLPTAAQRAADRIRNWRYTRDMRMNRRDWLIVTALSLVYAALAFTYLGDLDVPQTMWKASHTGESFVVEFGGTADIQEIWYYRGLSSSSAKMKFEVPDGNGGWAEAAVIDFTKEPYSDWSNELYKWFIAPESMTGDKVRVTIERPTLRLIEMVFMDAGGNAVPVQAVTAVDARDAEGPARLFDEQDLVPAYPSQMNGTYFDEIYHPRTAWEMLEGIEPYENTHPPLGKVLIGVGIRLFGMTPFGWRFMGALLGVLMIPAMYVFGKSLFRDSRLAFAAAFLMTFDCMHFTQTRLATIDTYGVFFIICMYACMYIYYRMTFNNTSLIRTLIPLGLSGVFFGLGAASKWICLYAGAGLAALFFYSLWMRFEEYRAARRGGDVDGEAAARVRRTFARNVTVTLMWCLLFFIVVPAGIYIASYIPYLHVTGAGHDLKDVWQNQINMYNYHAHLVDDHFFKSPWYQWPVIWKPMWYYQNTYLPAGWMGSIAAMGNPAVWWTGLAAMAALLWRAVRRRAADPVCLFLGAGFLAQFLPWMLVPRSMFIYHYFASVPFIIFAVVYFIKDRYMNRPDFRKKLWIYLGIVLFLFVWFYPIMSGLPIPSWLGRLTRWMPTWYFTY